MQLGECFYYPPVPPVGKRQLTCQRNGFIYFLEVFSKKLFHRVTLYRLPMIYSGRAATLQTPLRCNAARAAHTEGRDVWAYGNYTGDNLLFIRKASNFARVGRQVLCPMFALLLIDSVAELSQPNIITCVCASDSLSGCLQHRTPFGSTLLTVWENICSVVGLRKTKKTGVVLQ